jgi:plastocyanin
VIVRFGIERDTIGRSSVDSRRSTLPALEVAMRRPLLLIFLLAGAMVVSACAANEAPGWTFAPPTPSPSAGSSQSAAPSAAASSAAAPSATAAAVSAAPASQAAASADTSGGSGSGGTVINETAQGIAFQQTDLKAPANTPFTIHFDNQDASTIHNIQIKDANGNAVFTGDMVTGVAQKDYSVPALAPGTYTFVCQVHANMTGTLTVGP